MQERGLVGGAAAFLSDPYPASAVAGPLRLEIALWLKASDVSTVHELIQSCFLTCLNY